MTDASDSAVQARIALGGEQMNARLLLFWRVHTWGLLLLPLLGTVAALALAFYRGIGWLEIGLFLGMYSLSVIGVTVGLHRLFSHRSFQAHPALRALLSILGSISAQGPPIYWVSNHRRHHHNSDRPGDPHSPYFHWQQPLGKGRGLWHAHAGWLFHPELTNSMLYAKDLLQDPVMRRVNRLYPLWVALGLLVPAVAGGLLGGWHGVLLGFLWGGLVRIFLGFHMASSINSICHRYGSRPFDTREHSVNNAWLAIPTGGESWHNNHHAFPWSARFGLNKWQLDIGYWVIRCFAALGLVWDIKQPSAEVIVKKTW